MRRLLVPAITLATLVALAPAANAAWVSISDYDDSQELLQLQVNSGAAGVPYQSITVNDITQAGTGTVINTGNAATYGISNLTITSSGGPDPVTEGMFFTFADQVNWGADTFWYRYLVGSSDVSANNPNGYSDLLLVEGIGGTTPDHITFISSDILTGNLAADLATFGITSLTDATPFDLGTVSEDLGWVLGADTGVDQYYLNSQLPVPEPMSIALLGTGLVAFGAVRRLRRKTR